MKDLGKSDWQQRNKEAFPAAMARVSALLEHRSSRIRSEEIPQIFANDWTVPPYFTSAHAQSYPRLLPSMFCPGRLG
jgi:hypothetical protein